MTSTDPGIVHLSGQELYNRTLKARKVISESFLRAQIGHVIYQEYEGSDPKKRIASMLGITSPTKVKDCINERYINNACTCLANHNRYDETILF